MNVAVEAAVRQQYPDAIKDAGEATGMTCLVIRREEISRVSQFLKEELGFDCPSCLTAVDRGENIEIIYNLYSTSRKESLMLKVAVPREDPSVASVTEIWAGMDWQEREAYDMLGVTFTGHPDLRRILLPEDWEVFPLRKDYTETN